VVFGGFASNELAVRIDDAQPKIILTASCGLESAEKVWRDIGCMNALIPC
jgi:propionyl-CoA synthetase